MNVSLEISSIYKEAAEKFIKLAETVKQDSDKEGLAKPILEQSDMMLVQADKYLKTAKVEMLMDILK